MFKHKYNHDYPVNSGRFQSAVIGSVTFQLQHMCRHSCIPKLVCTYQVMHRVTTIIRSDEPNMLKNLPIIPSWTSQNFHPLFLFYSHIITYSFIILLIYILSMIIILLYWRKGCCQWRFLFTNCITAFMFTIIIILAILEVSSLHAAITAPDYSCIMLVNVL